MAKARLARLPVDLPFHRHPVRASTSVRLHYFVVELLHRANAARTIEATNKETTSLPGITLRPSPLEPPLLPGLALSQATTSPRIAAYLPTVTNSDHRHPSRPCIANQTRPRDAFCFRHPPFAPLPTPTIAIATFIIANTASLQ